MSDVLTGRLDSIGFEDILNGELYVNTKCQRNNARFFVQPRINAPDCVVPVFSTAA